MTYVSDLEDRSILEDKSQTNMSQKREPLITKAYDAFRKHKSVAKPQKMLVPTETYIED